MAKYVANPVVVDAWKITSVKPHEDAMGLVLTLENGQTRYAGTEMTVRYMPQVGDYWVMQRDGYVYLNPADVFERKYSPCDEDKPEKAA